LGLKISFWALLGVPQPSLLLIIAPPSAATHAQVTIVQHEAQADIAGAVHTNIHGHDGEVTTAQPHVTETVVAHAGAVIATTAVHQVTRDFQILYCNLSWLSPT
jgi:hypothetical protein